MLVSNTWFECKPDFFMNEGMRKNLFVSRSLLVDFLVGVNHGPIVPEESG